MEYPNVLCSCRIRNLLSNRDFLTLGPSANHARLSGRDIREVVTTRRRQSVVTSFLRSYIGRIIIASVLIVIVQATFIWLTVVVPYQREKQIEKAIEALGGFVVWNNEVPRCFPASLHHRIRLWNRIAVVDMDRNQMDDAGLKHLRDATHVNELFVSGNPITDTGLENLKTMKNLRVIWLIETQVTDRGLESLKELKDLAVVYLGDDTQTTPEGRVRLRKALPKCEITPNP